MKKMKNLFLVLSGFMILITSCGTKEKSAFAYGNFESEEIIVSSESTGKLLSFPINEGQILAKNELCASIDTSQLYLKKLQLLAGYSSVNARLSQIDKQVKVNEIALANLDREKKRVNSLLEGNAATAKQLDDILGQIDLMNAQTEALISQKATIRAEKESLDIQILQINDLISKAIVLSPISGTVLEKYIYSGELIATGKPLFKIADLSQMILRVFVSGDQLERIKIGSEIEVEIDSQNGELKKLKGIVTWVAANSEFTPKIIQTREERVNLVYAVKVRVQNDGSLKIGMPGEIIL
jgi:HlyD family secretion protein